MIVGKTDCKFVPKGWGFERWIWNDELYCGKLLFFAQGRKCSWHYHKLKDETFYIQSGELLVWYGWDEDFSKAANIILKKGDTFHVPPGLKHQMLGLVDTEMFEFSTTHSDDDSYRIIKGD